MQRLAVHVEQRVDLELAGRQGVDRRVDDRPGRAPREPGRCFIIAEAYKQEPEKVAAIVMLGNLAALGFVPLGLWLGM